MTLLDGGIPQSSVSKFGQLVTGPVANFRVQKGQCHTISKRFSIGGSATLILALDPTVYSGDGKTNIIFLPLVINGIGSRVNIDFKVGALFADDGTIIPSINRKIGASASNLIVRQNPTITSEGTIGTELLLPSDGVSAVAGGGGSISQSLPITMDTSLKYLLKLVNQTTQEAFISINASWFEF